MLTRIITALVLIPAVLGGIIYLPPIYFSIIVAALMLVGAWEWSCLVGFTANKPRIFYVVGVAIGLLFALFMPILLILSIAFCIWIWMLIAIMQYQKGGVGAGFQYPAVRAVTGFFILIATGISIIVLETHVGLGAPWLILTFLIIWAADVGAYFAGRFLGKHPLSSRVSPKKTWEGFFGGLLLSVIVAAIGGYVLALSQQKYAAFLLLALITALFSVVGDLGVSLLKRMVGVKDSGKFFPGHGGMLDRLDSIACATVVFTLGMLLIGL